MGARKLNLPRWPLVLTWMAAMILLAGCGRVDLEDLTPEAVKTQQAIDAANQPTPTDAPDPNATADPNQTSTTGGGGAPTGDIAAGSNLYNTSCSGCHEGGRAASLKGNVYDPAVYIPMLRSGEGFTAPHPKYELTAIRPLSDEDLTDIFAYLAVQ
jgi:mono/diheme cytochrome c family protein